MNLTNGTVNESFKGHNNRVTSLLLSEEENRLVSSGYDKTLMVWNTGTIR